MQLTCLSYPLNDKIVQLVKVLKCRPADLLGWNANDILTEDDTDTDITLEITKAGNAPWGEEIEEESVNIKLYGSLPAGITLNAIADLIGAEEIPAVWLTDDRKFIALKVKDLIMYPRYLEGDILIVMITPNCHNGGEALVFTDGAEATFRQVQHHDDGSLTLTPYNPEYAPRTPTNRELPGPPFLLLSKCEDRCGKNKNEAVAWVQRLLSITTASPDRYG